MVMIWPTLILATIVSFAAVVINDVAVSWGHGGVDRVILGSAEEIAYGRLRTKRTFSNDNVSVTVRRVEGKRLIQPTVLIFDSDRDAPLTITADEAEIHADFQKQAIIIRFENADVAAGESLSITHPGVLEWPVSLAAFSGRGEGSRSPSNYSLREIGPSKTLQRGEIDRLQQEMTADAAFALMSGRTFDVSQAVWIERERRLYGAQETLHRLYTEPHRRWANGFSCLCFVMLGAPMAIRRRQGEFWGSFFACFLPILLIYYPMLVGTVDYAKDGVFPPQTVWLGNFVLAGWGVWLMQRVIKY
jgi:lipopolysaccharide export system permease protein